jgi:CrcB protein
MIHLSILLGGALGALARYSLVGWTHSLVRSGFPWGTLVVNITGCFLLGFTLRWFEASVVSPELRALLTIGFLGAFTTFSTYSYESVALIRDGAWGRAIMYTGGSVVLGLVAVGVGLSIAGLLFRARA